MALCLTKKIVRVDIGYNTIKLAHGKEHFDMLVMGSRGRSWAKAIFFGCVSNYAIHTSKIPVVIVR
ncbi:MAG: universal stress protein [Nitrosopumilus sp.]